MAEDKTKQQQYDSYGFPVPENKTGNNDWVKVLLWSILAFFLLFYTMTGILAGYIAYSQNIGDPIYKMVFKVIGAFLFNWFYLGYLGVEKLIAAKK